MRFDDRLETTLRQTDDPALGLPTKWQLLLDILAQNSQDFDPELVVLGLQKARHLMDNIPADMRQQIVRSLAGRLQSMPLMLLLSGDVPAVASAAIRGAQLDDHEWAEIVPQLSTRARGFLSSRLDLGPMTLRALNDWSSAVFVLPGEAVDPSTPDATLEPVVPALETSASDQRKEEQFDVTIDPIDVIRFEADEYGTICWVEGAPLGAIVGVDIAEPAFDDGPGPDAYGAAAFRQKMPLENARMRLCGAPAIAGDWRINAVPFFDGLSGRFNGYRGILRRPNLSETAVIPKNYADDVEHIQQLLHELRTPLSAIIGFSEIIEQQLFGPVTEDYRILAGNILHDAGRLLSGFDDLSIAATIETGTYVAEEGVTECAWLSQKLADRLHGLTDLLQVRLNLVHADAVRPFAVDHQTAERLFSRLLSAVMIGCEPGEVLEGRFRTELGINATNRFVLALPKKLLDLDESALLGSGLGSIDDNDAAPLLGLGFSLRLVRSLARSLGGDLRFYHQALIVSVPAVSDGRSNYKNGEQE